MQNAHRGTNNNGVEGAQLSERLDSLDLDIDPSDLINDINFNNLMVMMVNFDSFYFLVRLLLTSTFSSYPFNQDSGNNITFNSSGNIAEASGITPGSLNTPQLFDSGDHSKNPMASSAQMARLQHELLSVQNQLSKQDNQEK